MQNGHRSTEDEKLDKKLDKALEDSFPGSDPVAITQPETREGAPRQHTQTAEQSVKDTANVIKNRASEKVRPDLLWLGGAFVVGCAVGLAAGKAPLPFERSMSSRLRRKIGSRVSDVRLERKLSALLDRLQ